jgi:hypothetical protein
VDYLSTYPTPAAGSLVSRTFPDGMCSANNMNYVEFLSFALEYVFTLDTCQPSMQPGYWEMYSADSCASTGQMTYTFYSDEACTNLVNTAKFYGYDCTEDDDGDDDDDDDDDDDYDDDDDDFETVGVTSLDFCT